MNNDHVPASWWLAMQEDISPGDAAELLQNRAEEDAELHEHFPEAAHADYLYDEAVTYRVTQRFYDDPKLESRRQELLRTSPQLRDIARWAAEEREIADRIRLAVCLLREWPTSPVSLGDLAIVTGKSRSGVRSLYEPATRDHLTSLLGESPHAPRGGELNALRVDAVPTEFAPDILLGTEPDGTPVTVPPDSVCLVDVPMDGNRGRELWQTVLSQVIDLVVASHDSTKPEKLLRQALSTAVPKDAVGNYRYSNETNTGANTPRLRMISSVASDPEVLPVDRQGLLVLFGHIRDLVPVSPSAYRIESPQHRYKWNWRITSPDGTVRQFHPARTGGVGASFFAANGAQLESAVSSLMYISELYFLFG